MKKTTTLLTALLALISLSRITNAQGPALFKDLTPGTANSHPTNFTEVGATMFFTTQDPALKGFQLWKSDGTAANTISLKTITATSTSCNIGNMCNVNGILYFTYNNNSGFPSDELWKSDGTETGTVKVKDLKSKVNYLTAVDSKLFFIGNNNYNISSANDELWVSDGTEAGTMLIKDLNPNGVGAIGPLTAYKGKVYFTAKLGNGNGQEFGYSSDGTAQNTVAAACSGGTIFKDEMYYYGNDGTNVGLFKSDGTTSTFISAGVIAWPRVFKDQLFFSRPVIQGPTFGLWRTDGTTNGTILLKDSISTLLDGVTSDNVYFRTTKYGFWKTDGTTSGTVKVTDKYTGLYPGQHTFVNNKIFWIAYDSTISYTKTRIFECDGTDAGTIKHSERIASVFAFKNTLYMNGQDGANGYELWSWKIADAPNTTSISENKVSALELIYPNPSSDGIFNVVLNSAQNTSLKVCNLLGETIYSEVITTTEKNHTLNLNHLSTGIYLVQVANGNQVSTQKLVIQ